MAPTLSPPAFSVVVIYPRGKDTYFNIDYYLQSHIPLAERLWGPFGMKLHSITHYGDTDESSAAYHLSCVLDWEGKEGFDRAQQSPSTKEVMDDVASGRITNVTPVFLSGVVAS